MELIINIPEELYRAYKDRPPMLGDAGIDMIAQSIANGIPRETVTEFADRCRECGREKVLDKIRAEIEAEIKGCETAIDMYKEKPDIVLCYKTMIQGYTKTLRIIDKYKAESEVSDADSD